MSLTNIVLEHRLPDIVLAIVFMILQLLLKTMMKYILAPPFQFPNKPPTLIGCFEKNLTKKYFTTF